MFMFTSLRVFTIKLVSLSIPLHVKCVIEFIQMIVLKYNVDFVYSWYRINYSVVRRMNFPIFGILGLSPQIAIANTIALQRANLNERFPLLHSNNWIERGPKRVDCTRLNERGSGWFKWEKASLYRHDDPS